MVLSAPKMWVTFSPMSLTLNYIVSSVYNNENMKKKMKQGRGKSTRMTNALDTCSGPMINFNVFFILLVKKKINLLKLPAIYFVWVGDIVAPRTYALGHERPALTTYNICNLIYRYSPITAYEINNTMFKYHSGDPRTMAALRERKE